MPAELLDLSYIDRFGVEAVYGRKELSYGEIRRMITAENVYQAIRSRNAAMDGNIAEWASKNKQAAKLLYEVEELLDAAD